MGDEGDIIDSSDSCIVCGEKRVMIKAGFLYCVECGTRSQESQPMLDFTAEFTTTGLNYKKVNSKKSKSTAGETWTTWHAHNIILLGLTEELACCGSQEDSLKRTTLKIWGNFLRKKKIAFFETNLCSQPYLPYGFIPRDLQYLYGIEKPKKTRKVTKEAKSSAISDARLSRRAVSQKKSAYVRQKFNQYLASQTSDLPEASQTLADLKISQESNKPKKLLLTTRTKKLLARKCSLSNLKKHINEGLCGPRCQCLKKVSFTNIKDRFTILNLYAILVLALRINDDAIQVSDVIRWCREGHLSYAKYDHFFPYDMVFKKGDRLRCQLSTAPKLNHFKIRKAAGYVAKTFQYKIKSPNIQSLVLRYIKELELPLELYNKITSLMVLLEPIDDYDPKTNTLLPNYEGIAMSYIIVTLKILFGLDDITENENSQSVEKINEILGLQKKQKVFPKELVSDFEHEKQSSEARLFNWKKWMEYIEYRKICLSEYHYPTRLEQYPGECDKPELFLHHKKVCKKGLEEFQSKNETDKFFKSFLERGEDGQDIREEMFPKFHCSLYPMASSIETLLLWNSHSPASEFNKDILEEDFSSYNISYMINPKNIKKQLRKSKIELLVVDDRNMCVNNKMFRKCLSAKKHVLGNTDDVEVTNCLYSDWISSLEFDNFIKCYQEKCENHLTTIKYAGLNSLSGGIFISKKKTRLKLNLCFKKYWIRHLNVINLSQTSFKKVCNDLPLNFSWLLKECAKTTEMSEHHLYMEVCQLEKKLIQCKENL